MAYAEVQNVRDAVSDDALTSVSDEKAQRINDAVIIKHIEDAQSLVDMYLRSAAYAVPFTSSVPVEVRRMTVDIATYYLYSRTLEEMDMNNVRRQNYERAIATLTAILQAYKDGLRPMLDAPMIAGDTSAPDVILGSANTRLFPKDFWKLLP